MTNEKIIVLRLEAPLQSWGEQSPWNTRDTANMPTKSGIVGLLGCAMGLPRGSQELVELEKNMRIAIRADRAGSRTIDYQTVTGNPMRTAEGKARSIGNTIVTPRVYLADACFTVFVSVPDTWRERIVQSLNNPVWLIYLGRKCCVPTRPVLECENYPSNSLLTALTSYPLSKRTSDQILCEYDYDGKNNAYVLRPDILDGANRQFGLRQVTRELLQKGELHVPD